MALRNANNYVVKPQREGGGMYYSCLYLTIDSCLGLYSISLAFERYDSVYKGWLGAVASTSDSLLVDTCQLWVQIPIKAPVVILSKKLYSDCLVLVGYRSEDCIWVWLTKAEVYASPLYLYTNCILVYTIHVYNSRNQLKVYYSQVYEYLPLCTYLM